MGILASQQLLVSFHVRERDKGLLKGFLSGVYGMDFYSDRSEGKAFPAVFVVDKMVFVTCFGIVLILRLYLYGNYLSSRVFSLVT